MAIFTIQEACQATGGIIEQSGQRSEFTAVCTDTRNIIAGCLFVALTGERFDGHDFVREAVEKGAAGALVSKHIELMQQAAVITVPDTRKALQDLAAFHRLRYQIPVVAVTGSNGKTTTKDMIAAVLSTGFTVLKTEANYNNEIGLPLTLLNLTAVHRAAVVEMGMRGKGEIKALADIARPTVGVVTNVGESHIERLGSKQGIADAKAELVAAVGKDGCMILNGDDPLVRAMKEKSAARTIFYGVDTQADVKALAVESGSDGVSFTCQAFGAEFPVRLTVPGRHNVYNALAAIAAGLELGLRTADIAAGLASFTAGKMRLCIEQRAGMTIINDAYNASPLSMNAAIDTLSDVARGRKIAVLGDMLEMGDFAPAAHRDIGLKLAQSKVDAVITVGALARYIAEAAAQAGVGLAKACENHEQAKAALKDMIRPGDTLLIKGSRGMQMEKMLEMF